MLTPALYKVRYVAYFQCAPKKMSSSKQWAVKSINDVTAYIGKCWDW